MMAAFLAGMVFVSVCIAIPFIAAHFPMHLVYRAKNRKDGKK